MMILFKENVEITDIRNIVHTETLSVPLQQQCDVQIKV